VEANINVRIAPFNTVDDVIKHIRKVIKNDNIKIEVFDVNKMYGECDFNSEGYKKIKDTVYKNDGVTLEPEVIFKGRKQ
jgi:UDP-N-acetylenolpyruvoylglucosamine reductase